MTTLYRPDSTTCTVKPVTAKGDRDEDGETICVNSHFKTEREAWAWLVRDAEAGLSLGARHLTQARETVRKITDELADDAVRLVKAKDGLAAIVDRVVDLG